MWRDEAYLLDMLIAARTAREFLGDRDLEAFCEDELRQSAIARQLEIIGAAASKVSARFVAEHSQIPWAAITGMRHRLVHDYRHVDVARVWHAAAIRVPELIEVLEPLIPPDEDAA
jgi:uncharacterized protein with HEPN domain